VPELDKLGGLIRDRLREPGDGLLESLFDFRYLGGFGADPGVERGSEVRVPFHEGHALAARLAADRDRIVLPAPDGPLTLRHALRLLDQADITPSDVALHQPSLDDVFLALTRGGTSTEPQHAGRTA
jgi:hypothetical protein